MVRARVRSSEGADGARSVQSMKVRRGGEMYGYVNADGKMYNMSLSNTCMDCHSNKADFCDRCHDYASVQPYCWSCHIEDPKEKT